MRKNLFILTLALTMLMVLTGCGCDHEWNAATCITPKTCVLCNETEGEALGHTWEAATCLEPEKCSVCHELSNYGGQQAEHRSPVYHRLHQGALRKVGL